VPLFTELPRANVLGNRTAPVRWVSVPLNGFDKDMLFDTYTPDPYRMYAL
jgi:hypothetical protein